MGGPAGVPNAVGAMPSGFWRITFFQIPQLAFGVAQLQAVSVPAHSNCRRVVAAVLQLSQAFFNDDFDDFLLTYISDDATHDEAPGTVGGALSRTPIWFFAGALAAPVYCRCQKGKRLQPPG